MKKVKLILILLLLAVVGCERVNVFDPDSTDESGNNSQSDFEMLTFNLTGGFAGLYQELHLYADGRAELITTWEKEQMRVELTPSEVAGLVSVFERNHFFDLNSSYNSREVMDAFNYEISYSNGSRHKKVTTNGFDIPQNLQNILEYLHSLLDKISRYGLEMSLAVDKNVLEPGQSAVISFVVKNNTKEPLALDFNSSKIFELYAYSDFPPDGHTPVWSYNYNKVFLPVINRSTMEPGGEQRYQAEWDGTDNNGKRRSGAFYLVAELVSIPGGRTAPAKIVIK